MGTTEHVFSETIPALTTSTVAHPDSWNPIHQKLLGNTMFLRDTAGRIAGDLLRVEQELGRRVDAVEQSSSVATQRAVQLDWLYRNNRIAFELWAPGFTLLDMDSVDVVDGVAGDDSLDVVSTQRLRVGEYYALTTEVEDERLVQMVRVAAVLSDTRIRLHDNLTSNIQAGVLNRCSFDIVGASHANGEPGDLWLSRTINIGAGTGAVVVRRSHNSALVRLFYRDNLTSEWTERPWSFRRQGGDIPEGFADYEYSLPMRGDGNLRIDIEGEPVTIRHIVAIATVTGLGGFVNPESRPAAPSIAQPVDGATSVIETPTIAIDTYSSPVGTGMNALRVQLSASPDFQGLLHDSGWQSAGLSYTVPAGNLPENTLIYARAAVRDNSGLESEWGAASSFQTMMTYAYVSTPSVLSPTNGAIDVDRTPIIRITAFNTVGGSDTHAGTRIQVREVASTWDNPAWDSGVLGAVTEAQIPNEILQPNRQYVIRAQVEGTSLGLSEWSSESRFTTKESFASVVGVALLPSDTFTHIDEEGRVIAKPPRSHFDAHEVWGAIKDVTIDGQRMVEIPRFYFRRGSVTVPPYSTPSPAFWLSDKPLPGFTIHPAFRSGGADLDRIWVGKYQASMDGAKLASKPGVLPTVSRSLTQFIADAQARNTGGVSGFMLWSFWQWSAIQWLYLIEHASGDSQATTGQGRVTASSAANVDASDVAQATYRGIVGLWGNVWQWLDGMKTVSGVVNLWDADGNKSWIPTTTRTGNPSSWIWPKTFMSGGLLDAAMLGDTGPSSEAGAAIKDGQYMNNSSEDFPLVGGHWSYGAHAGLWYLYCNRSASSSNSNIGARLAKV